MDYPNLLKLLLLDFWNCFLLTHMGGNPGGDGGVLSPPRFCRWGTQYQMSPPRFCSRTIFRRKNTDFTKICCLFFFFCLSECRSPPNLSLKNCQRRWRCGKKVSESPPPPTILQVGDTISNVPPHVFVVGRFFVEKIRILPKICCLFFFFFFFLACQNVGVPLICRLKIVNVDGAAEKKVSESPPPPPPPPPHQLFW